MKKDAKSCGCDIFPVHLCHVLLCHLCICVHFPRALESQAERCLHISHHIGLHRFAHCAHCPHSPFIDPRPAACTHRTKAQRACFFQASEWIYLRPSDPSRFVNCGAMASSTGSLVLHLRDAAGNHAQRRTMGESDRSQDRLEQSVQERNVSWYAVWDCFARLSETS